jgi:hypothetical protein
VGDRVGEARQVLVGHLHVSFLVGKYGGFLVGKCGSHTDLALLGDITGDGSCADRGPVLVVDGRHRHGYGEGGAVLTLPHRLVVRDALAAPDLSQDVRDLADSIWRAQLRHRLTDRLISRLPIHARGALIPGQYHPIK